MARAEYYVVPRLLISGQQELGNFNAFLALFARNLPIRSVMDEADMPVKLFVCASYI
jgi:hypothetical protein